MKNNPPKVTVIIPTYNRSHLIQRSINSVLNQTYKNIEIIVVDDCSLDDTEKIIKDINDNRLIYLKNANNLGPSASRNRGIERAAGTIIAFQDSDDIWVDNKLEKQINFLFNSPKDVVAVHSGMEFIDYKTGKKFGENIKEVNFRENFSKGSFLLTPSTQTVLIKKSVLDEVGYFDERLFAHEDTELAIRVSKKYRYGYVNEPLVRVTRNHDQLMANNKNYTIAHELIYEKHKDYLSKKILFGLCKEIANYYILKLNYKAAKAYLKNHLNINLI